MIWSIVGGSAVLVSALIGAAAWQLRRRHMQRWLPTYLRQWRRFRRPPLEQDVHLILCIADHYEPKANQADVAAGRRRVAAWTEQYPRQFARFRDSGGRTPRHTFFFPIEEYEK